MYYTLCGRLFCSSLNLHAKLDTRIICLTESGTHTKVFYSGGNILEFFRIEQRQAIEVTWAHGANSKQELDQSLNGESLNVF